jgi:arylsulfatase A-like enzyme
MKPWSLLSALVLSGLAAVQAAPDKHPNVIVFLVDDMGWMDCGVYGSKYYETPNIERLADRAMRFTNAYSRAPVLPYSWHVSMSGKHSARHGILTASGHQPAPGGAGHAFFPETAPRTKPIADP